MNVVKGVFILLGFAGIIFSTRAQTTRDTKAYVPEAQYSQTKKKEKQFLFGWFSKNERKMTDREEHEAFRERMADNQKKKLKELKKADKPQYTDPLFFGHKKPPKKRKNGKKKFCKECGLKH